jgi:GNAT superfamily N-acetyltransferase
MKKLTYKPVTMKEWKDLQKLFSKGHEFKGCWCMYWRIKRSEFSKHYGEKNKMALRKIIQSGHVPGILCYLGNEPIGWCSIAPREAFSVLDRSATLKRVDDKPVWSIVCFFVAQEYRHQGYSKTIIKAGLAYAKKQGAKIIEAYPFKPQKSKVQSYQSYMGFHSTFKKLGFRVTVSRSKIRPIMRLFL